MGPQAMLTVMPGMVGTGRKDDDQDGGGGHDPQFIQKVLKHAVPDDDVDDDDGA